MRITHPDFIAEQIGEMLLIIHTRKPPPDAGWDQLTSESGFSLSAARALPMLVLTDGGSPTGPQRAKVQDVIRRDRPKTAVVSEAAAIRFVVTSLMFFNDNVGSFAPPRIDEAIDWFGLPPATAADTRRGLLRIAREPGAERFETLQRAVAALRRT